MEMCGTWPVGKRGRAIAHETVGLPAAGEVWATAWAGGGETQREDAVNNVLVDWGELLSRVGPRDGGGV